MISYLLKSLLFSSIISSMFFLASYCQQHERTVDTGAGVVAVGDQQQQIDATLNQLESLTDQLKTIREAR